MTFRQQLERWLEASTMSSAKAGAVAVKAFATPSVAHDLGVPVDPLSLKTAGVIFLGTFLWHFVNCLSSAPMPPDETANPKGN